ncbi:putative ABC transporter permease [Roseburia intestinalis]|nr:putative ABC transporter permease [Roseburia intestinalis]UWP55689.1 hypothetical protein NQ522_00085 [Roseburia intestinalis]VCV20181.1 hypothetical protein RIL182_00017 [Roseburia intestinalis L1-82]
MPQNCYELVWIFIIYAFIGWCTEVSYAALDRGIFVNRGFLNGPYCPIYGCGVVIVVAVLTPLKDNLLILFIGSFLLTSILEYITGYLLEKVFHNQWWDYSDKPFNIHGYVCLKFSIYWGLACTFIMDVLHPIIYKGITLMPHIVGMILICIIMTVFFVDCGITVATILKFNKRLKIMDEMAERIHKLSDEIGENIYENVTDIVEKSEEFQETHAELLDKLAETTGAAKDKIAETTGTAKNKITGTTETAREKIAETTGTAKEKITDTAANAKLAISENIMEAKSSFEAKKNAWTEKSEEWKKNREKQKAELSELSEKYEHLFEEKNFGFQRLMKAFPDMKSRENDKTLTEFKKHFRLDKPEQK